VNETSFWHYFFKLQIIKRGDPNVLVNVTGYKLRTKGIYILTNIDAQKILSIKIIFQPQYSRPMNVLVGTVYKKDAWKFIIKKDNGI